MPSVDLIYRKNDFKKIIHFRREDETLVLRTVVVFSRFYAYVYRGVIRDSPPREGTAA